MSDRGAQDEPGAASEEPTWSSDVELTTAAAIHLLETGELEIVGRVVEASNATLFCELKPALPDARDPSAVHAIYKPIRGERPLDDFPDHTLAMREVSAWLLSEETGWGVVPPTVLRDGPAGRGMLQIWIDVDQSVDILELILTRDERLRRIALLDAVLNNADRKGGHILPTESGRIHGCDHGVCFAVESKLRTVLWGWRGEPLTDDEARVLRRVSTALDGRLGRRLGELLDGAEVDATCRRVARLLREHSMPMPDPYRHVIPWPPF
jgi:hypothetical protein